MELSGHLLQLKSRSFGFGFWKGEEGYQDAISATKWLIRERLQLSLSDIPSLRGSNFEQHGLGSMLKDVFKGFPYLAVDATYPGQFKNWEFFVENHFWEGNEGLRHAKEAIVWLLSEKVVKRGVGPKCRI